jgi:hypothetical protein
MTHGIHGCANVAFSNQPFGVKHFQTNHGPRFTISLKRSTQNLQLSTNWPADYPIL